MWEESNIEYLDLDLIVMAFILTINILTLDLDDLTLLLASSCESVLQTRLLLETLSC